MHAAAQQRGRFSTTVCAQFGHANGCMKGAAFANIRWDGRSRCSHLNLHKETASRAAVVPGGSPRLACRRGEYAVKQENRNNSNANLPSVARAGKASRDCDYRRQEVLNARLRPVSGEAVAERVGFEPTIESPLCRISSAVLSTTQPPLHEGRKRHNKLISQRFIGAFSCGACAPGPSEGVSLLTVTPHGKPFPRAYGFFMHCLFAAIDLLWRLPA